MLFLKKRKRLGLVLGSGGARGLAHIGVIKVLLKNKVPFEVVVGSSSGALVGGYYASHGEVASLEVLMQEITYKDLAGVLVDPSLKTGLIRGEKTMSFLKKILGTKKIENLPVTYAAVATDLFSADKVVFDKGDLAEAVRASISVPLVYEPVRYKDKTLVDGGVSFPVPVEVAREMGAEKVVAVNLDGVYFQDKRKVGARTTVGILKDSYFALRYNLAKKEIQNADVIIEPEMSYVVDFNFVGGQKMIEAGEKATLRAMSQIKKLL